MKLKSVAFRCSSSQLKRIDEGMIALNKENRTVFISNALEEFLNFAEKDEVRELDLFGLVDRVDRIGSRHRFSRHE